MRTTVNLNDTLLRLAKSAAAARNCSLGAVIDEALAATLAARPKSAAKVPVKPLVTHGGTGLLPGVDLGSSGALLDAMEDPR